jgi:type II secretion system protein G
MNQKARSRQRHSSLAKGFTLIELLIVVAIIAILAAIAVPNFLEAQTRAKVTRVKADHRALATAMESYQVDNGAYPEDSDNTPTPGQQGFYFLTSPVAYITSLVRDPFNHDRETNLALYYEMGSGADNVASGGSFFGGSVNRRVQTFMIYSIATDHNDDTDGNDSFPFTCDCSVYDPTNGTVSDGDIYRYGGEFNSGNWTISRKAHSLWTVTEVMPN